MSDQPTKADPHPGMMGDGTEEQNLNICEVQEGDPKARITKEEVNSRRSLQGRAQAEVERAQHAYRSPPQIPSSRT